MAEAPAHPMVSDRDIVAAAINVVRAIEQAGTHPRYHYAVLSRHRREWPTLWRRIDKLRSATNAWLVERGQQ